MRQVFLCHRWPARLTKTVLSLALLATVLASCTPVPQPFPQIRLGGNRLHFPLAMTGDYLWQRSGYGRPPQSPVNDRELRGRGMWHYTWGMTCDGLAIPMVFNGHDLPPADVLARCGATAPVLLVYNEPEWGSQGNTSPADGAKALRYLEQRWAGELWCCGNLVSHAGWLDQMMAAYKAEFGESPRVSGVHLHIYVNDGLAVESPGDGQWLARSQSELERYMAVMAKHGVPLRIVVSECCLLGKYSEAIYLEIMERYRSWLASVPQVESVAWFSARYAPYSEANLLEPGGRLSALGERWLELRWK